MRSDALDRQAAPAASRCGRDCATCAARLCQPPERETDPAAAPPTTSGSSPPKA